MLPAVELYTPDAERISTTLAEPCAVLIENSEAYFGLLLSEACSQDSWSTDFMLVHVAYFRADRKGFTKQVFNDVLLTQTHGMYVAIENSMHAALPNYSTRPYVLSYMPESHWALLQRYLKEGRESKLFHWAQQAFGDLPGFSAVGNTLTSPTDYANIPPSEFNTISDA